ncbi:hypothetical protein AWN76_007970 [Rhodothermaceae bacterium RA]|nr:hypothetical protein AWN76_007970 [Rhodothermaceae bacterium RA]
MRLPDWDKATVKAYETRWSALKASGPTDVYSAVATLLSTQSDNPVPEDLIRHLVGSKNRKRHYHTVEIPKRRGGVRTLTVPSDTMKWVQRGLLQVLTHLFPRHRCAVGFERGESPLTHARHHVRKRFVYVVDIEDFFPSITWARIYGMLQAYPFELPPHAARVLANLATYDGALPQGAPSSPILANLLCRKLDSRLFKWARTNGYQYSRYADDLAFSTNKNEFPVSDRKFIEQVIQEEGFSINAEKSRLMPYSRRQMVTGLIVNKKPNLPRSYVRGLRALLHNVERHGWESQVGRTPVFKRAYEWTLYRDKKMSPEKLLGIQLDQIFYDHLVHPTAVLHKARDVASLQRVVQGRIAYLGLVRGKDCPIYQRMRDQYLALVRQESEMARGRAIYQEKAREVESTPDEPKGPNRYAEIKKYEQLPEPEYRSKLQELGVRTLEYLFLLRTNQSFEDLKKVAARIAYSTTTSPEETARFFAEFDDDKTFRGLLHEPIGLELSPGELVGACEEALSRYKLPNKLRKRTEELLEECRVLLHANPDVYPWKNDNLRDKVLLPYKKDTRFDVAHGLTLKERLEEHIQILEKRYDKFFEVDADLMLRTFVPDVLNAIKILLISMAQHTSAGKIHIQVPEVLGQGPIEIHIFDEDSVMQCAPDLLKGVLKGESAGALRRLRGYAYWTITAPFSDGSSYTFNVMTNEKFKAPEPASGVRHTLTFPQV